MSMEETIAQRDEINGTTRNMNAMKKEDRIDLARHLLRKYGHKCPSTVTDRLEAAVFGYEFCPSVIAHLQAIGVGL